MLHRPLISSAISVATLTLAATAATHDGDLKALHVQPARPGAAFRAASLLAPGGGPEQLGLALPPFGGEGVRLLSWLPLFALDASANANDVWGYASPAGRNYAIIGTFASTVFVDVTSPQDAQVVATVGGPASLWRDIKVYGEHAYAVSEGGDGIQVMDLSQIDNGQVALLGTVNAAGTTSTHNCAVDEVSGFLYRCGGGSHGLRVYSLANPANPTFVGQWNGKYVHDAQVVTYTSGPLAGKEIAFCCAGFGGGGVQTGLTILDVTNKSNIQVLDEVFYPQPAYSHQGWLSPDRQYFYLGDELDEDGSLATTTHVIDVSDPSNAFWVDSFTNGNPSIGHNIYTQDDLIFEANYRSGLRVFDASADPVQPTEVAYFDTSPTNDEDTFNGLWSVYPYLPNGVVLASDREGGLFVLWAREPLVDIGFPGGVPELVDPGGDALQVQLTESELGALVPGSARLVFEGGPVTGDVPLVDQGGGQYVAVFPPLPCTTEVQWYIAADSTNNVTWTSPENAPFERHLSVAAHSTTPVLAFDMESDAGWTVGGPGDDATDGLWTRGDPVGTAIQPEDDHTPVGFDCWVTGQGAPGGGPAQDDVDGGKTTLVSPVMDLSGCQAPVVSYWRWYSNSGPVAPNADRLKVDVSNDAGQSWTNVELVGPSGEETDGGWFSQRFALGQYVTPTADVVMRFIASDEAANSWVEAALDDFEVVDHTCDSCLQTTYCTAPPNSAGGPGIMGVGGALNIATDFFLLLAVQVPAGQFGVFFYGSGATEVPFGDGNLCVGGPIYRLPVVQTDVFGTAIHQVDFDDPPQAAGEITPGSTWSFQFWFRDPTGGPAAFNLTDAVEVTFCE